MQSDFISSQPIFSIGKLGFIGPCCGDFYDLCADIGGNGRSGVVY
jgi:hypothetical protein